MLSILIPTYNYNISNLVVEIHKQATKSKIKFEIICFDDNSNKYTNDNKLTIETLANARMIISNKNLGRVASRQKLAKASIYNLLLFLDADVFPKSNRFIENYINEINSQHKAVFGGFAYSKEQPDSNVILRWKYGKTFEEVDASKRNARPYQVIISANFLIDKRIFSEIHSKIKTKNYGLDNYFASLLKQNSTDILHINNEVYHLGLETNQVYLKKIKEAIKTLLKLFKYNQMPKHDNKLLSIFQLLKKIKLNYILAYLYKILNSLIKENLLGKNPNLVLLQLYKTLYICYQDLKYYRT